MELEHMSLGGLRSRNQLGLNEIKVRKEIVDDDEKRSGEEEEPLSPMARMFHEPESNVYIIGMVGFKSPIEPHTFKANLTETFLKHPRFSSVQVADEKNGKEVKWVKTKVDIDNHVKIAMVDDDQEADMASPDKFVEDYVANITKTQISMSIPMWDCHILNLKTRDAESTVVFRVHHSLGDGTSFMSLLISCSDSLPSFPAMKRSRPDASGEWFSSWFGRCWSLLLLMWNSLVDIWMCVATCYLLKDTQTPLKAPSRSVAFTSRRIVRRTLCLDDVKLVKNATNTTVNDVVLAVTQAGLSRYLNREHDKATSEIIEEWENNLRNNTIRLTATLFINLRSSAGVYAITEMVKKNSKTEWGNKIGYVLFPFKIALKDNPLDYIRDVKATMDRKKATLEAKFRLFMARVFVRFYPTKLATFPLTTMWFSNVAGPQDQISLFGNQVTFIAPSLYGQPVALTIHVVSYVKKISMVLSVDENIIPNPYQLCDDFEEAFKIIKESVITTEGPININ